MRSEKMTNTDPETKAITDIVLPFVSRENIRGKSRQDTLQHLTELITQIATKVYGK